MYVSFFVYTSRYTMTTACVQILIQQLRKYKYIYIYTCMCVLLHIYKQIHTDNIMCADPHPAALQVQALVHLHQAAQAAQAAPHHRHQAAPAAHREWIHEIPHSCLALT